MGGESGAVGRHLPIRAQAAAECGQQPETDARLYMGENTCR